MDVIADHGVGLADGAGHPGQSTAIQHITPQDLPMERLTIAGDDSDVRFGEVVTRPPGFPMSSGVVTIAKGQLPWHLDYDEVVYVIEGELHITAAGELIIASAGDVILITKGSEVIYSSPLWTKFFYITYPTSVIARH